jgi:hypothetical protein
VKHGLVLAAVMALLLASPAGAAAPSCPGPGCLPIGTFSIPVPAAGKATFYVVTISGKGSKAPKFGASLNNSSAVKGHLKIAAVSPKPSVKSGTVKLTFYIAMDNTNKKLVSGLLGGVGFEAFAGAGQMSNVGKPVVTSVSCSVLKKDEKSVGQGGDAWDQFWESASPKPGTDALTLIVEAFAHGGC